MLLYSKKEFYSNSNGTENNFENKSKKIFKIYICKRLNN